MIAMIAKVAISQKFNSLVNGRKRLNASPELTVVQNPIALTSVG